MTGSRDLAASDGERLAEPRLREQPFDGVSEAVDVARLDEQAGLPVDDELGDPGHTGRHRGDLHRHRFHERHGNSVLVASGGPHGGEDEHLGSSEELADALLRNRAVQADDALEAARADLALELLAERPVAPARRR
jgi:hypothetical protein